VFPGFTVLMRRAADEFLPGVAGVELPPEDVNFQVNGVGNSPPDGALATGGWLPVTLSLLLSACSAT
jgi:hypothetical protein